MLVRSLLLVGIASGALGACAEPEPPVPEVVEVRTWDERCSVNRGGERPPFPPDTVAYPPGRRFELRVVSLGGCVDSLFYREERRIYAALDSLGVPGTTVAWPYDGWDDLTVLPLEGNERPSPVDSAFKVVLDRPGTTAVAFYGFSPDLGVLWAEVHQGPHFRLKRIERSAGGAVELKWEDGSWPLGGPGGASEEEVEAHIDSLYQQAPSWRFDRRGV